MGIVKLGRIGRIGRNAWAHGRQYLAALGMLCVLLLVWEVWVRVAHVPDYVLPAPSGIAAAFNQSASVLWPHIETTAVESVLGLIVGACVGVVVAAAMALSPMVNRVVAPLIVGSQTVPIIVLAPVLVLWFGYGLTPKVIVVGLITFFPVAIAGLGAMNSVDPEQIELIESMGAQRVATLRLVRFPAAVPAMLDGLRISAAYTVAGAVIGEWTGASRGLGVFIARSQASFRVDQVFVGVVTVAALSTALFVAIGVVGRVLAPWHFARHREPRRDGRPS